MSHPIPKAAWAADVAAEPKRRQSLAWLFAFAKRFHLQVAWRAERAAGDRGAGRISWGMHFLLPLVILGVLGFFAVRALFSSTPEARRRRLREDLKAIQEEDRQEELRRSSAS